MSDLHDVLAELGTPHILVLGDLMLDRYIWGDAQRVSPEAPALILNADDQELRLGGAASVAGLLRGLDATVALAGVVGDDANGRSLQRLIDEHGIHRAGVLLEPGRVTTTKERIMGRAPNRHPHQILRVDHECRDAIAAESESGLMDFIRENLSACDALLVSDYGKGVCTPAVIERSIAAARERKLPVIVDPARDAEYARYRGATLLTPNRTEASAATGLTIQTIDDAIEAGSSILNQCGVQAVMVTLDRDGIVLVPGDGDPVHFATQERSIYDITGAGDLVLAITGLCQAAEVELADTIKLANLAAGLEVERLGVAPVTRSELAAESIAARSQSPGKVVEFEAAKDAVRLFQRQGKRIVFTNGCFDLLHVGHVSYLREAASLGDVLIVAVNSDRSVRKLKGDDRPVIGERDRAAMLAALECVDFVLIFDDETPHRLLRAIRPDVLVKGGTYTPAEVVGREVVAAYGGEIRVAGQVPGRSTTSLIQNLHQRKETADVASHDH